jgi:hypothetical protein
MKNEHVLSGLLTKRAELTGQVEELQREIRELVAALDHVDATIRVFDPNVDLEDIKPRLPPRYQAFKGEVCRLVLNALRKSQKPLPVSELTLVVLQGRGLNPDDEPFLRVLSRRVGACLEMTRSPGSLGLWRIVN